MAWTVKISGKLMFRERPTKEEIIGVLQMLNNNPEGRAFVEGKFHEPEPFHIGFVEVDPQIEKK